MDRFHRPCSTLWDTAGESTGRRPYTETGRVRQPYPLGCHKQPAWRPLYLVTGSNRDGISYGYQARLTRTTSLWTDTIGARRQTGTDSRCCHETILNDRGLNIRLVHCHRYLED